MNDVTNAAEKDYIVVEDFFQLKWAVIFKFFDKILKFFQNLFS